MPVKWAAKRWPRWLLPHLAGCAATVLGCRACLGLTISSASFTRSEIAPLAGTLRVQTDAPSTLRVEVNDGHSAWQRRFYDLAMDHAIPLFGLKPGRNHLITITAQAQDGTTATAPEPLTFLSDPLPGDFPNIHLLQSQPEKMEPGYTLFRVEIHSNTYAYVVIVDSDGEVVWYAKTPSTADVRQLDNGTLFMPAKTNFVEMNLLGETVRSWAAPAGLPIDSHDGVPTSHGTILYLADATNTVTEFPTSVTNPDASTATAAVYFQKGVELSATNGEVLATWDPTEIIDPRRISYLVGRIAPGWDWEHANAILEDPADDSLIISMRHQNAVIKIAREDGQLRWILGPPENWGPEWQPYLLKPVGTPFLWSYGQHAPALTRQGTLLLYDNGNFRAMPFDPRLADTNNFSRAVEYQIDEQSMEVSQVWEYGGTNVSERLFTPYEGSARPLANGNVLIGFPAVRYVNGAPASPAYPTATFARIKEVTHESTPEVVFDLTISMADKPEATYHDCTIYRCVRIADLYGHILAPVQSVRLVRLSGAVQLQFSADAAYTYNVEASEDLRDWESLGPAVAVGDDLPDKFQFTDLAGTRPARYYRIVTLPAD
ncbi:MAG: aryl-sulfate sulfotransferase [Verrucomicrobiota bacterium]